MADANEKVERLRAMRQTIETLAKNAAKGMSQTELHGATDLWPDWAPGGFYVPRQLVRYEGHMYMVLRDVDNAKADEVPDKAADAYKLMSEPNADGVFPYSAPLGDSDAYGKGDRVTLQDVVYVSLVDGNRSIPGQGDDGQKYWAKA